MNSWAQFFQHIGKHVNKLQEKKNLFWFSPTYEGQPNLQTCFKAKSDLEILLFSGRNSLKSSCSSREMKKIQVCLILEFEIQV